MEREAISKVMEKKKKIICPRPHSASPMLNPVWGSITLHRHQSGSCWQTGPDTEIAVPKSDTTCLHKKSRVASSCRRSGKGEETCSKAPQRGTMHSPGRPPSPRPRRRSTLAALPASRTREGSIRFPRSILAHSINPRSYL